MKRQEFLRTMGKGIALSSVMPFTGRLPLASALTDENAPLARNPKQGTDYVDRPEGYHLVWEDNFSGKSLKESDGFYRMDMKMSSQQRPENVAVQDGKLVLAMKQEDFLGMKFTGAGIVSKRQWQHGYYEVRAKLTNAAGWHHAFWAQEGTGFLTYCFDRFMEIDVFEMEDTTGSNYNLWTHRDGWSSQKRNWHSVHNQPLGFDAADGYHLYGYEYTHEGIRFYVDGKMTHRIDASEDEYKHYSMSLWLTVIATHSDKVAKLPAYDYFDYVRCYAKDPTAALPAKLEPPMETGDIIYVDNYDPWGFNMGDYWYISTEGETFHRKNYYKWKSKEGYNPERDWALFRPHVSRDGNYDIYLRWPAGEDRARKVPLEIWYEGGAKSDTTRSINQQEHDGEWVKIGNYPFKAGWNNLIKLIARGPGYTIADSAKFVRIS